jgi:catechol 2,3-dioxygenase-like lactoylglutathione lyase family enzyme
MFSHITVGTKHLGVSAAFYDAVLIPLGLQRRIVTPDGGPEAACWISPNQLLPRFYVYAPFNGKPATLGNGGMVAFLSPSIQAVDESYKHGMAAGGTDEGAPGERANYGAGYYGAYLRDPDGNKIHIVFRGDMF